jgi:hypothetical protein
VTLPPEWFADSYVRHWPIVAPSDFPTRAEIRYRPGRPEPWEWYFLARWPLGWAPEHHFGNTDSLTVATRECEQLQQRYEAAVRKGPSL